MQEATIDKLIDTAMSNIKSMVDVDTIVGSPVETVDGSVIIPISRVSFGFVAGGGELQDREQKKQENPPPFAGGTGAGVTLNPMAFLVVTSEQVRLLPVSKHAVLERLLNLTPELLQQLEKIFKN